jgi:hydrogenase maturation protein HypF
LPQACRRPILALGGQLKVTFALGKERQAILSHHIGDLDHLRAYQAYTQAIEHYCQLFAVEPTLLVHDLHPDYASTRYARQQGIPCLAVQHHHAHLASCLADNELDEPAIGVIFDGAGYGTDGTIWGGEFLIGDYREFRRAAHFRNVPMPGGEQAVREPWRMALAHLRDAGEDASWWRSNLDQRALRIAERMIERRLNSPLTSSVGRLFDAVAALAGIRRQVRYEGQAAMELECLAAEVAHDDCYPFALTAAADAPTLQIDTRPLIGAVAGDVRHGVPAQRIARRFHSTLVEIIGEVCAVLRSRTALKVVALGGGVFANALLLTETCAALSADGFRVCRHRQVPSNDGGLCLGQLAIAAASLSRPTGET